MAANSFTITGKLIRKDETEQKTEKFSTRIFIVELEDEKNPDWNQEIKFQLNNSATSYIDNIPVGAMVEVDFNLKGRPSTNKETGAITHWNTLQVWKIRQATGVPTEQPKEVASDLTPPVPGDDSDLPF